MNILILVGSLRTDSWTAQLMAAAQRLLPPGAHAQVYDGLRDLPYYDQDLDTDTPPAAVVALREAVRRADRIVVATPEYNGSMPGLLKNAIDWVSRPRNDSALAETPVAVVSVSPSPRGAQWAREDVEKVLRIAGALPLEQSVGVPTVHAALTDGNLNDPELEQSLRDLLRALVDADPESAAA